MSYHLVLSDLDHLCIHVINKISKKGYIFPNRAHNLKKTFC